MHALVLVAAQYAGVLDLADTSTLSVRVPTPPQIITQSGQLKKIVIAADLSTIPSARLGLQGRAWNLLIGYSPSVTAPDVELGFPATDPPHRVQLLQTGLASLGWHSRFLRFLVTESGSYGTAYYSQLLTAAALTPPTMPGQGPMTGQTGTPAQTASMAQTNTPAQASNAPLSIPFAASNTSATLAARVGRDAMLSLLGGYILTGGTTANAQLFVPEQRGPNVGLSFAYAASPLDTATTSASYQETETTGLCPPPQSGRCQQQTPLGQAVEILRHQMSAVATLTVGAGAAIANNIQTITTQQTALLPVVSGLLAYRLGVGRVTIFSLSAGLIPAVDFRTGLPTDRVQTIASLSQPITRTTTLVVSANLQQSVPYWVPAGHGSESGWVDGYPFTAVTGGVDVRIRLDRERTLGVGVQGTEQYEFQFGTITSTTDYVSLTLNPQFTATMGLQAFRQDQQVSGIPNGLSTSSYVSITARWLPLRF